MTDLDLWLIGGYFALVVAAGFVAGRRGSGSRGVDGYFLGGRRMHWLTLSMSGSVSNFDITGTMWLVSMVMMLGMRSMWVHWMWGFMSGAFFLSYMAVWVRRSGVRTGAEWMVTRFGDGAAGRAARLTFAVYAVVLTVGLVAYAYQGIGKFAAVYVPLGEWAAGWGWLGEGGQAWVAGNEAGVLAGSVIGLTALYVLYGGMRSVVVTDVIQNGILLLGSCYLIWLAWKVAAPEAAGVLPGEFTRLDVPWRLPEGEAGPQGEFAPFGWLVVMWVLKGVLQNAGGPAAAYEYQRFLATRSERDAAKAGAAWSVFLVLRWGMVMAIALLAWTSFGAGGDPEKVMPRVLQEFLPTGVRGLLISGLLAAFMSTFSSTINAGASYVVCDLWLPFRGGAGEPGERRVAFVSKAATLALVALGVGAGCLGDSINHVWSWLMLGLASAVLVPGVLRWHWWRMNGWGYTAGVAGGLLGLGAVSGAEVLFGDEVFGEHGKDFAIFGVTTGASLAGCLLGSLLTAPAPEETLREFVRTVRPFGFWGRFRAEGSASGRMVLVNVALGMTGIAAAYLCPMYLVGRWYGQSALCLSVLLAVVFVMRWTWYKRLPEEGSRPRDRR